MVSILIDRLVLCFCILKRKKEVILDRQPLALVTVEFVNKACRKSEYRYLMVMVRMTNLALATMKFARYYGHIPSAEGSPSYLFRLQLWNRLLVGCNVNLWNSFDTTIITNMGK